MEFAQPWALLAALLAIPVLAVSVRGRRRGLPLPATAAIARAAPTVRLRFARALPVLLAVAVVLLAVALAGPRVGDANALVPGQGVDITLAVDTSSSMSTEYGRGDITRLDAAISVVRDFIKGRKDDRIGVVIFQREALALSPPSLDYPALDRIVADVKSGLLPDGTAIGLGLSTAVNMLRESTAASRVVILLTDGQQNATSITPSDAADVAASLRVRVYTIGVTSRQRSGEVDAKLLTSMADRTGGKYFEADNPETLRSVYDEIGRLETSSIGRDRFERFDELAPWFAIPAVLLIALELGLSGTWLRRGTA